jgi:5-methyltetrahydropteroyltriglutamate--homocysteine methyltransferase
VGSLPRPTDGDFDLSRVIAQQTAAGISVVNDGEWTRDNYIADIITRIHGLRGGDDDCDKGEKCKPCYPMPLAEDMKDVPQYATRFTGGNGLITLNPKRQAVSDLACVAHPRYIAQSVNPSVQPFVEALRKSGVDTSDAFFSVPSPGTLALFCADLFFKDHAAYVQALGEALAGEFEQIAASGLQLQVDCPDLAMGRHTRWSDLSDEQFLQVAKTNIDALNTALQNVPVEQIRVHVCWGNYAGPHHKDLPADLVWPLLGQLKAKYLLVEGANARHSNDIAAFERAVKNGNFKPHQVVVPGLLDTKTACVENPQMIAATLLRYARAAGHPSRVMGATDCGFASTAKSTAVTADIAWMKFRSLSEGARLATNLIIEQAAPVPCRAPTFQSTPFRVAILCAPEDSKYAYGLAEALQAIRAHSVEVLLQDHFEALRWAVDTPLALVGVGASGAKEAQRTLLKIQEDQAVSRRPAAVITVGSGPGFTLQRAAADEVAAAVRETMLAQTSFDKRCLVLPRFSTPPAKADVVIVGAGLLGMVTARRCLDAGFTVAVLEQRPLVGGIWSMYANATSQVNSSEGGYCIKEFIGEEDGKEGDNRDHSTAAEVLKDFAKLGDSLKENIFTSVKVVKVMGKEGDYQVFFQDDGSSTTTSAVLQCRGVVLCINDRVGLPRPLTAPGKDIFKGIVADGTADSLSGVNWRGKNVVIFGMGAFAVENVRTALENGAAKVTVVGRRTGTICPKVIDYLNFVKPWDENYKHDTQTNVKQFLRWKELYATSGCTIPECWPKQVKHEGHTISVSDVWFIGHHMKKLSTRTGEIDRMEAEGVRISSGELIPCDVIVGCIGFERSNYLCEYLTGRNSVRHTNYLDKDMMYLADAEIDEGAFNSFFGSSVLEYGKFFSNVFVEGLKRGSELGDRLWGEEVPLAPITERKWNQYIAAGLQLIRTDAAIAEHARTQVDNRTKHFWRTLPPKSFIAVNRKEWEELHQRLNGGVPVPKDQQLPYFFEDAHEWC